MYSPLTSPETICLRCCIRLSRQARLGQTRRHFRKITTASQNFKSPEEGGKARKSFIRYTGGDKRSKKKIYGRLGDERVEESAKLRIDSLGKPSEVIVMRDTDSEEAPKKLAWRSVMLKDESRKARLSQEKIVEMVESEGDALSQGQINTNIDSLRDSMGGGLNTPISVSKSEYEDVYDILYKGYTAEQLEAYLQSAASAKEAPSRNSSQQSIFLSKSIWKPGESPSTVRLPIEEDSEIQLSEQKTPKGTLVTKLMRDHWRVHVHDTENLIGELEIKIRPWQLALLRLGEPSYLEQIRDRRKARFETISGKDFAIIRITTDLRTARNTVRDFVELLSGIQSKRIDLASFKKWLSDLSDNERPSSLFSQRHLKVIENYTGTSIQVAGRETVVLNGIKQTDIEDAQRMLIPLLQHHKRISSNTIFDKGNGGLIRSFVPYSGRPFFQETALLSRWAKPLSRSTPETPKANDRTESLSEQNTASMEKFMPKLLKDLSREVPKGAERLGEFWDPMPATKISAKIGHALYPHFPEKKTSFLKHRPNSDTALKSANLKGLVFSPDSSGFLPYLRHLDPPDKGWSTSLKVTLTPSPFTKEGHGAGLKYPEVSLYFKVRPDSLEFAGIFATLDQSRTHVLLPSKTTDVQLEKKWLLKGSKTLMANSAVRQFCSELQRTYSQGNSKLRAPLSIILPIPRSVVEPSVLKKTKKGKVKTYKPVRVEYMFATLEQHQTLEFKFGEHKLEYTSVEAGRIGGSYNQLELKMRTPVPSSWRSKPYKSNDGLTESSDQVKDDSGQLDRESDSSLAADGANSGLGEESTSESDVQESEEEETTSTETSKQDEVEETASEETSRQDEIEKTTSEETSKQDQANASSLDPLLPQKKSFIRSISQLVEIASNPRPSIYTQPMGWFPGATEYFKSIRRYDPGTNQNEYDDDAGPDLTDAEKTITDVTNERINEWLQIREREEKKRRQGSTFQDLLEQVKKDGEKSKVPDAGVDTIEGRSSEKTGPEKVDADRKDENDV
ncbi:MAG: hypothetical protein M1821_006953 [Bathelium mastoideum]|nr:MAG: hypothetical protein M1821_006953 [Bathelium mastoideum]